MRLTARWTLHSSKTILEELDKIQKYADGLGLKAHITGKTPLISTMMDSLVSTFFYSIGGAFFIISLLLIITLRSLKMGLLSIIPNIVPVLSVLGILYLAGIPLDVGSVMVVSICLGIVVDDTIHFLINYKNYRKNGIDQKTAISTVLQYTAPALIVTSVVLMLGFGAFLFASFKPNINFGFAVTIALLVALIADLMMLPALLLKLRSDDL